ncbi:hypothetical protein PFISCL1PPCAC_1185, partial [Pristionchus fissidentatus]
QFILLCLLSFVVVSSKGLSKSCRELLSCAINRGCIKTSFLAAHFSMTKQITSQMYDDLATAIDYGCIFNTGCNDECNACNLCMSSKLQLTDVLSGESASGECDTLVNCATQCIARAGAESEKIVNCLLHGCAFHCFNGSCSKCSQFTTRVFNQACVTGDLRKAINFNGQCHDLFRNIVYAKFKSDFDAAGKQPQIGHL